MVNFCDKCGAELKNDSARFCDKCGAEVKTSSNGIVTHRGVVICPHCGQTTPMGLESCENCGQSLENNTTAAIAGYIVTLLFGILGIIPAIYLLTRKNGKAKTHGVILIALIIIGFILRWNLSFLIAFVILLILTIAGITLWYNNFTLFDK